tara:strand:+ start:671 stop:832 length:162 start_codon:yes stop_codon:yes gene_type:complete
MSKLREKYINALAEKAAILRNIAVFKHTTNIDEFNHQLSIVDEEIKFLKSILN